MSYLLIAVATACSLSFSSAILPSGDALQSTTLSSDLVLHQDDPGGERLNGAEEALMLIPGIKIKISWSGSGFLCLGGGNSCKVEIEGGLNVQAAPETYGFPAGSDVGYINMIDNQPIEQQAPLYLGGRNVDGDDVQVTDGDPLPPGTTIYIPDQETVFDPNGGHMFYYFGG